MIPRLLIIAASVLAGALSTLFIRKALIGDDPGLEPMPDHVFRPRRRAPRTQLDARSDGQSVEP